VERRRLDDAPLSVAVRSDSVNLTVLEALSPDVRRASGRFQASVDVGGSWTRPVLSGEAVVRDGAFSLLSTGCATAGPRPTSASPATACGSRGSA
jgi:autotransporter translocation and assembly factor TamB